MLQMLWLDHYNCTWYLYWQRSEAAGICMQPLFEKRLWPETSSAHTLSKQKHNHLNSFHDDNLEPKHSQIDHDPNNDINIA